MTHRRLALPLLIALLTLPASAQASDRTKNTDKTLRADLVRLAKAAGGTGGFTVLDGATGRIVAESGGNSARPLGSTAKLLTTGAALLQRRVTHLSTAALTAAPLDPATGTLGGDLILRGGGDPLLDEARLQQVADEVQARGIKVITGAVVGDGSAFDALTGGPATDGAFDLNFAGSIGALTYERGRQAQDGPLQPDPARAAAYRFDDMLEARGLRIRGTPRAGVTPPARRSSGRSRRRAARSSRTSTRSPTTSRPRCSPRTSLCGAALRSPRRPPRAPRSSVPRPGGSG